MNTEFEKQLNQLISGQLPQQLGEQLKKRLEEGDKAIEELKIVREREQKHLVEIQGLEAKIKAFGKLEEREAEIDQKASKLEEDERNLKVSTLEIQLAVEKEKSEFAVGVARGLVRNTQFRKSIFDSEVSGQPVIDQYGQVHHPAPTTKQYTEEGGSE